MVNGPPNDWQIAQTRAGPLKTDSPIKFLLRVNLRLSLAWPLAICPRLFIAFALPLPVQTTIMARLQDVIDEVCLAVGFSEQFFGPYYHLARRKFIPPD
jgi:hypothetical protein